jgi:hypothetical protein
LFIGKTYITVLNDDTPDKETEVYNNLPMICINPKCDYYGGTDLGNPIKTITIIKNKLV